MSQNYQKLSESLQHENHVLKARLADANKQLDLISQIIGGDGETYDVHTQFCDYLHELSEGNNKRLERVELLENEKKLALDKANELANENRQLRSKLYANSQ